MKPLTKRYILILLVSFTLSLLLNACSGNETVNEATKIEETPRIGGLEIPRINLTENAEILDGIKFKWLRINGLKWAEVEKEEGIYDWESVSDLETELKLANSMGFEVILIVRQTPEWAQIEDGSLCGPINEEHFNAFSKFLDQAVTRFSNEPFNVKYWEIWNEPGAPFQTKRINAPYGCWGDKTDEYFGGEYYGRLLKTIYPAIRESDPDASVLVGGLLLDCDPINPPLLEEGTNKTKDCRQARFLDGIINAGGGDYFDGISFHAYDYYYGKLGRYGNENWSSNWQSTGPVITAKTEFLKSTLMKNNISEKLLINTETALICGDPDSPVCKSDEFEQTKSSYVTQSYVTAVANNLDGNVWYSLYGWRGSGLLNQDSSKTEAYHSYKTVLNALEGSHFIGMVDISSDVKAFEFRNEHASFWIIWSTHVNGVKILMENEPSMIMSKTGQEIPIAKELDLGFEPIYIYWNID